MNRRRFLVSLAAGAVYLAWPPYLRAVSYLYGDDGWERRERTEYIVVHHTAGAVNCGPDCVRSYLVHRRGFRGMVYHVLIGQDGEIWRCVGPGALTWHAGYWANSESVAVTLVGCFMRQDYAGRPDGPRIPPDAQLVAAAQAIAELRARYGDIPVIGHQDAPGCATACPGDTWYEWRERLN